MLAVAPAPPVPILTYHQVQAAPAAPRLPASASFWVSAQHFDAQLTALARAGYHGVTLSQAWAAWHGGRALPAKPVVVSFDDGYTSQYTTGRRVLERLHWPGVLNLETARLDVPGGLATAQVRTLLRRGWELSSHTLTHPDLTQVSAARRTQEIAGSRTLLQRRFGVRVRFIAYPYGRHNAAVRASVRAAGYTGATTTRQRVAKPTSDRFALPRITISPRTTGAQLLKRLRG
jgi:peptidoglycan/xylan/chitin deacetylase (PgdA/CDA1 family)